MSLQIYLGQIWTQELIRPQGHATLLCMQHYLHMEFLANVLPPMSSHLPSPQRFPESSPLHCEFPFHNILFSSVIRKISSKPAHFLFPSGFILPQSMCTNSRQLPKSATSCHNSCFLILTAVHNLIFPKYYYV